MREREHLEEFLRRTELPQEAVLALRGADTLFAEHIEEFRAAVEKFYQCGFSFDAIEAQLETIARKTGLSIYTADAMFVIYASVRMKKDFERVGIPEDIFWDTIRDLEYKLKECREVKGVWGTFVLSWYRIFFELNLFKLGRLEFERQKYGGKAYEKGGYSLKKCDTVYNVHIPSCGSLTKQLRLDSYKRAFDFFSEERGGRPLFCVCHSWLLFEGNREIFPPDINLVGFMDDWDITESQETEVFADAWRVFGADYTKAPEKMPRNTRQQKALAEWLSDGKKTGEGFGILIFDGEKII